MSGGDLTIESEHRSPALETICQLCDGTGFMDGVCPDCEGRGGFPTELGEMLLAFVRRHLSCSVASKGKPMTTRSTHPGAILREDVLPALFAEQTGIDIETLQEILAERADVTPEIAEKLGKRLRNGRELWLTLQKWHDEWKNAYAKAGNDVLERLRCCAKAQAHRAQATAALKVKVHPRVEEITPEMIRAGSDAVACRWMDIIADDGPSVIETLVAEVYLAMENVSERKRC